MVLSQFIASFGFDPLRSGNFGIEREYFLIDKDNRLAPRSPQFLSQADHPAWGYELSACQVEHRTAPARMPEEIRELLVAGERYGQAVAAALGLSIKAIEVAPENMPRDIYPHNERYAQIAKRLPPEVLLAALRVTGIHVHFGVPDINEAIRVHNRLAINLDRLIAAGDGSNGERMQLYRVVAPNCRPPLYESPDHFFRVAQDENFADNPRNCWHLVRITGHGTVETRVFGMTHDAERILSWIEMMKDVISAR